jgi:hypothetical protein
MGLAVIDAREHASRDGRQRGAQIVAQIGLDLPMRPGFVALHLFEPLGVNALATAMGAGPATMAMPARPEEGTSS